MTTTIADPLALMLRTEGGALPGGGAAVAAESGEGGDFALALADLLVAPVTDGAGEPVTVPVVTAVTIAEDMPATPDLPVLEGVGTIAVPLMPDVPAPLPPTVPLPAPAVAADGSLVAVDPVAAANAGDGADVPAPQVGPAPVAAAGDAVPRGGERLGDTPDAAAATVLPAATVGRRPDAARPVADAVAGKVDGTEDADADPTSARTEEAAPPDGLPVAGAVVAAVQTVAAAAATDTATPTGATKDTPAEAVRTGAVLALPQRTAKVARTEGTEKAETEPAPDGAPEPEKSEKADEKRVSADRPAVQFQTLQPAQQPERRSQDPAAPAPPEAVKAADAAGAAPVAATAGAAPLAQPTTTAGVPVAVDRPGWEAAVADRIAAELSEDGQQIELDLSPERLGGLRITLEVIDGQAQVRFVTETPEAARLIQQNEHRLSESLSRAGLSLGGHESASRDAQGQGDRQGRGAPRGAEIAFHRASEPRQGVASGRAGSGLVNLIA